MKKFLFIVLLCSSVFWLFGCKNEDDLLREGKYQEAYDMCKDPEKKDDILRENKYAVIIKNCKEISELDENTFITYIVNKKYGDIEYLFSVNRKQTLGDGYYQDHYYFFRSDGAKVGDIYYSDILELRKEEEDKYDRRDNVIRVNKALGRDYTYGSSISDFSYVLDGVWLGSLAFKEDEKNENQKIIDNLNYLIHNKKISNVNLIKK